jgi:hypothetical protein
MTSLTSKPHSSSLSPGSVQRTEKISTRAKNHAASIKVRVRCVRDQGAGGANKKFHLFHYGDDSYSYRISLIRSQRKGKKKCGWETAAVGAQSTRKLTLCCVRLLFRIKIYRFAGANSFPMKVEIEQKIQLPHRCRISCTALCAAKCNLLISGCSSENECVRAGAIYLCIIVYRKMHLSCALQPAHLHIEWMQQQDLSPRDQTC